MTPKQKIETTRWALVPIAILVGIGVAILISLPMNALIHWLLWSAGHPMPGKLFISYVLPFDGAVAGSLFLLLGSFMAPSHRQHVATILLICGGLLAWLTVGHFYSPIHHSTGPERVWGPLIGTSIGALITYGALYIKFRHQKIG